VGLKRASSARESSRGSEKEALDLREDEAQRKTEGGRQIGARPDQTVGWQYSIAWLTPLASATRERETAVHWAKRLSAPRRVGEKGGNVESLNAGES